MTSLVMGPAKTLLGSILLLLVMTVTATAAPEINTLSRKGFSYKPDGIAIRGYDTVAYFTEGKPVKGKKEFSTDWKGATWRFSSQENLDLFNADQEKYAPQYGGYCAYGVAQGSLVKIEPDQWAIVDGKLYLNYNKKFNDLWKKDIAGYNAEADKKFSELLAQ